MNLKYFQPLTSIFLLLFSFVAYAEYPNMTELTGQYDITGKTVIDPPHVEPRDTHFRVLLTGESARDLYNNMKVAPIEDICLGDGSLSKFIGNMQCTKLSGKEQYECRFSIDIENQVIAYGWAC